MNWSSVSKKFAGRPRNYELQHHKPDKVNVTTQLTRRVEHTDWYKAATERQRLAKLKKQKIKKRKAKGRKSKRK